MSSLSLFVVGSLVTVLVTASMALLVWGAILDGRYQRAVEEAEKEAAGHGHLKHLRAVDAA